MPKVAAIIVLVACVAAPTAADAQPGPPPDGACGFPCRENFDDGRFDHATMSGLWHLSSCAPAWSGRTYLGFSNEATCVYPEGQINAGQATLWLDLSSTTTAVLRFMDTTMVDASEGHDHTIMEVSADGSVWEVLAGPKRTRSGSWRRFSVDLSAYTGDAAVAVRWRFDTVDMFINNMSGWSIDDVVVDATPLCAGNDARANACLMSAARYQNQQMTDGFTLEEGELGPCGIGGATAWYRYDHQGPAELLAVDTLGSTFESVVGVGLGYIPTVCSDRQSLRDTRGRVTFLAVSRQTYLIQVGGRDGATGSLNIELVPANSLA